MYAPNPPEAIQARAWDFLPILHLHFAVKVADNLEMWAQGQQLGKTTEKCEVLSSIDTLEY